MTTDPGPDAPREPYEPRASATLTPLILILAAAAATTGVLLAPDPWPAGAGELTVSFGGRTVASTTIEGGATEELRLAGRAGDVELIVDLPGGIPSDAPVEARVRARRRGEAFRPALDAVSLRLALSDGRDETIPVLRWDADERALIAVRRPPVRTAPVLGLLGVVVVLWVTEAIPLFVTSLAVPVVLVTADATSATDALSPFFHPVIALFFGGFLMAEAMRRVRLDHLAAVAIVARAGRSPASLFAALLVVSAFLSMWMSNTAAVAVLIPVALAVTKPLQNLGYRKAAILGIAYAATLGGVGSAIGTPANPLAIAFLGDFAGRELRFVDWFAFGLPMVVLFLPIMGVYLWRRAGVPVDRALFAGARDAARAELRGIGRLTRDQGIVLLVFAGVLATWLTQTRHGLDTGIVAVGGAVALALLGRVRPEDLGRISWASLLTFGGGLALGFALVESGTADHVATRLGGLEAIPPALAVAVVAAVTLGVTTVASNTASAAMLVPLAIPLAGVLGVDPVRLVVVVAVASSIDFALVIGTPPTMLAYSTELFTTREIFRTGIVLDLAGVVLLTTGVVALWDALGLT